MILKSVFHFRKTLNGMPKLVNALMRHFLSRIKSSTINLKQKHHFITTKIDIKNLLEADFKIW